MFSTLQQMLILLTWHWPFLGNYRQASIVRLTLLGISKIGLLSPEDPWPKADTRLAQVFKWWWRSLKWWAIQDRNFYGNTLRCILIMCLTQYHVLCRWFVYDDEREHSFGWIWSLPPSVFASAAVAGTNVNPQVEEFTPADKPISKTGPFPSPTCRMVIMMKMKWKSSQISESPRVFPTCWTLDPSYIGSGHVFYNLGEVLPKSKIQSINFTKQ